MIYYIFMHEICSDVADLIFFVFFIIICKQRWELDEQS